MAMFMGYDVAYQPRLRIQELPIWNEWVLLYSRSIAGHDKKRSLAETFIVWP